MIVKVGLLVEIVFICVVMKIEVNVLVFIFLGVGC